MVSKYCSASFCSNNSKKNPNLKFHRFPANTEIKKKWWEFCQRGEKKVKTGYICSEHFQESDYNLLKIALNSSEQNKYVLNKESVPTILSKACSMTDRDQSLIEGFVNYEFELQEELLHEEYLEEFEEYSTIQRVPISEDSTKIHIELNQLKAQVNELKEIISVKDLKILELEERLKITEPESCNVDLNLNSSTSPVPEIQILDSKNSQKHVNLAQYIDDLEKQNEEILKSTSIELAPCQNEKSLAENSMDCDFSSDTSSVNYFEIVPKCGPALNVERQESLIIIPPNPKMILYPPKKGDNPTLAFTEYTQTFVCPKCSEIFLQQRHLSAHENTAHPPADGYSCNSCDKKFEKFQLLRRHQKIHVVDNKMCEYCGKVYLNNKEYLRHMRLHSIAKKYACEYCEKTFHLKIHLENHLRVHTGEKPFQCDQCEASFKQSYALTLHLRRHQNVTYNCFKCNSLFTQKTSLKRHQGRCNGSYKKSKRVPLKNNWRKPVDDLISCCMQHCSFQCKNEVTFNKHLKNDHKIEIIETRCKYCNLDLESETLWEEHMKNHEKDGTEETQKKHECSLCQTHFNSADSFSLHQEKFHKDDENRPHKCSICSVAFKKSEHLKIHHAWKHSTARPFKCPHCKFASPQQWDLNAHMKKHLEEREYKCRLCNYESTTNSNLRKHYEMIHNTKDIYKCESCATMFEYLDQLREHKKTVHVG